MAENSYSALLIETDDDLFGPGIHDIKPNEKPEDWVRRILGSRRYRYYRNGT
jgi:hypothetical protein